MDRIHLFAFCHGFFEGKAVIIKLMNGVKKLLIGNLLLFKNHAVSLFFEGTGIQNLVTTACIGGQRDQEIWFMESTDLTDCISSCTGNHNVCQGKEIRQFVFDIFVLNISGSTGQFSSIFPLPHRWITWKSFRSSGRILRTWSLTEAAPRLPPMIIRTGLSAVKPQN